MTGSKRILIITSNEYLIQQISSNEYEDTFIFDLDNQKQNNLNQNNISINLSSLEDLTQLNCSNDQLSKRGLDSSDLNDQQSKSNKIIKKSNDFICQICNDHAIGYNYDVLSCAPCKIFFRRNANQNLETMRCLTGEHHCSVDYQTRRKCTRCRLEKCFSVGMKKEFILTDEQKQRRKKIEPQSISKMSTESNQICKEIDRNCNNNDNLSIEDRLIIEKLQCSFVRLFEDGQEQCACVDVTDRTSALITWSHFVQQITLRFVNYFRQIEQFEQLDLDDRSTLIKYNVFPVTLLSKCFYYKTINDCCSEDDNEHSRRQRRMLLLCTGTNETRQLFVQMVLSLVELTKQDPVILSLLAIILLFSRGLSMSENESLLNKSIDVYQVQSFYLKVLWNYLLTQSGPLETEKFFSNLITIILRIQSSSYKMRQYFQREYTTSDAVDQIAPLIQTVLNIS